MTVVVFELDAVEKLQEAAALRTMETCAVGFVVPAGVNDKFERLVVRELDEVPDGAYLTRNSYAVTLKPAFLLDVANRARAAGYGVLLAHTHPGADALRGFSQMDNNGEISVAEYLGRRVPAGRHLTAVFTSQTVYCRPIGQGALAETVAVGRNIRRFNTAGDNASNEEPRFDRQVRAFGKNGQSAVKATRLAVVGLGGTGSFVAQELAHLGVQDFLLIDPDVVEETNLNRILGATTADIGRRKVEVAERAIHGVNHAAHVTSIAGDVVNPPIANLLLDRDFIFICTDSMASRAVVNQLAYQYLVPCIDIGVGIHTGKGSVTAVVGRVLTPTEN